MIKDLLIDKTSQEKSLIKSEEISKLNHVGEFTETKFGFKIEIQALKTIEVDGQSGIEVTARAWKGTKQLGFGPDGSIEIERFRIFNPPILVDDPNGDVVREFTIKNPITGEVVLHQRKLREDPIEAIRQDLAHTISIVGKDNGRITKGIIGNTTTTVYPDANPETNTVDGYVARILSAGSGETLATLRQGAGNGSSDIEPADTFIQLKADTSGTGYIQNVVAVFGFNTASIPDTDTISSAPTTPTTLASADYSKPTTTAASGLFSFDDWRALTNNTYGDHALNA